MNALIENINKLHTTAMGEERIKRNLSIEVKDAAAWCKEKTAAADIIIRNGKNWYVYADNAIITVNARSFTIITAHRSKADIKDITPADYPMLEEFQYHAIFVPQGTEAPARDIIYNPDVYIYIDKFGTRPGDFGVTAEIKGKAVGAAWTRIIPAYGHIDDDTPELAISILPGYRGKSIGTMMMARLFKLLRDNGYKQTSLAVQKENAALRFYERLGYRTIGESEQEFIMIKNLTGDLTGE